MFTFYPHDYHKTRAMIECLDTENKDVFYCLTLISFVSTLFVSQGLCSSCCWSLKTLLINKWIKHNVIWMPPWPKYTWQGKCVVGCGKLENRGPRESEAMRVTIKVKAEVTPTPVLPWQQQLRQFFRGTHSREHNLFSYFIFLMTAQVTSDM